MKSSNESRFPIVARLWGALQTLFARLCGFDIFISYRRADGRSYAQILHKELSKQFVVFRDETDIDYGEEFPSLLRRRISRCRMLLVVVTSKALEEDSWVSKEVGMRLESARRKRFGLFPRKGRIVPVYFDGILPESIEASHPSITAIRDSNGERVDQEKWDPRVTRVKISRTFGALRLRRMIALGACTAIVGLLLAAVAALVSTTSPYYWYQIDRPLAGSEYDERWLEPITDVAVSRNDPSHVLYLGEVSIYDEDSESDYLVPHIISTAGDNDITMDDVALSSLSSKDEILARLQDDDEWVTSLEPALSKATTWDLPLNVDLQTKLNSDCPLASDLMGLVSVLSSLYSASGFANVDFSSRKADGWVLERFEYHWWEPIQGHYQGNDETVDVAIRFGVRGEWRLVDIEDIVDIWPTDTTGESALLLTSKEGFFWTNDGGVNWEPANFGESGFMDGARVKALVAGREIYAYIDRGHKDNPLFRLKGRSVFERLRVGIRKVLAS